MTDRRDDAPPRTFTRSHDDEIDIALSAIDCVLNGRKAVYASSELTSGRRVFDLLVAHKVTGRDALKEKLGSTIYQERVWNENEANGRAFARAVEERWPDRVVITPAPLSAPGWSQHEYLSFWRTLLETRIDRVCFNDGWQFSDGCTFEYVVAAECGLPTFDAALRPLDLQTAIDLLQRAIEQYAQAGLPASALTEYLDRIRAIAAEKMSSAPKR